MIEGRKVGGKRKRSPARIVAANHPSRMKARDEDDEDDGKRKLRKRSPVKRRSNVVVVSANIFSFFFGC